MNSNKELIIRFHSLDGSTAPEKWRSFNSFLKSLPSTGSSQHDLIDLLNSIIPKNSAEEGFKIAIMIEFKVYGAIINELKANNQLLIAKLLKNWKAFGDIFTNIDPQVFIEDICPYLSFRAKLKILNGISKYIKEEQVVDKFFIAVESKYGLKLAAILLRGCSVNLIKLNIGRYYVKLSNRQLISIFKRDKDFLSYFLDLSKEIKLTGRFGGHFYKRAFKEFAQTHPDVFWKVNDEYKIDVAFGKRITAKMFRNRNSILKGHSFLDNFPKLKWLYKAAKKSNQLCDFLASLFPATHEECANERFQHHMGKFIEHFPRSEQYTIFSEAFKTKYDVNLLDYPEYCKEYLQMIPTPLREPIIDKLIADDETLIKFYAPSKSIPIIKNKLQHCGDPDYRARLVGWMYKSCTINDDRQALVELLDYVTRRYKNDILVLTVLFNNLLNFPDVAELDDASWQKIVDINKVLEASRPSYDNGNFYTKFFSHLIEYDKPLGEHCRKRLHERFILHDDVSFWTFQVGNRYQKVFLEEMGKHVSLYKSHKHYQIICESYLSQLVQFNTSHGKSNPIDLENYSVLFDQLINTKSYWGPLIIKYGLKQYPSVEIWHDLFWSQAKTSTDNTILSWYVQKWPQRVADNINKLLDGLVYRFVKLLLKQAKRFLDQTSLDIFKNHALGMLDSPEYETVSFGVLILSYISPTTLLDLASSLITNTSIERCPKNEFIRKKLMIKRIHRVGDSKNVLSLLLKHCNNRFCIRYVSSPLWSIAYNMPELYIRGELIKFVDGPVSARRIILILSKYLFKSDDFAKILQTLNQRESDPSMKNTLFEKVSEYLCENPSEFFWNSFKASVRSIDDNNRDMYISLLEIQKIPQEYLPEYIPLVFEQISSNSYWEIKNKRFQLLEAIPNHAIDNLNMEFLKRIIKESACLEKVSNFHWKCVFNTSHVKQEELFEKNFKTLNEFILENRQNLNRIGKIRNTINNFASRFVDAALDAKQGVCLIEKFIVSWNSNKELNTFYQSLITVRFTNLYFKSDFDVYKTGMGIKSLLDEYVKIVGFSIIPSFSDQLDIFLGTTAIKKENEVLKFVKGLFDESPDENIFALLTNILKKNTPTPSNLQYYNEILKAIMSCKAPTLKFWLNSYFEQVDTVNV